MTTQTATVTLSGPQGAFKFTATCTDDAFTELLDAVNGLHLHEVCKGMTFNAYMGHYAAGSGFMRVRNTQTQNKLKTLEGFGVISKGQQLRPLPNPFTVQDNDIIEAFTTVAGS